MVLNCPVVRFFNARLIITLENDGVVKESLLGIYTTSSCCGCNAPKWTLFVFGGATNLASNEHPVQPCAANPAIASLLQSTRPAGRVAELLGSSATSAN